MRRHLARIVAAVALSLGGVALANEGPPPPRPPASRPTTSSQPATKPLGKTAAWNRAGGIALGLGAAALVAAGGLYLARRRN